MLPVDGMEVAIKTIPHTIRFLVTIGVRLGRQPVDGAADLMVSQLLKLGTQPIQLQLGGRYYAENRWRPRVGVVLHRDVVDPEMNRHP